MLLVMRAILIKLQLFLDIAPVFACCIIAPFAFTALQGYQFYYCFFARHNKTSLKIWVKPSFIINS